MRKTKTTFAAAAAALLLAAPATLTAKIEGRYHASDIETNHIGANLQVNAEISLDSLTLGRNDQLFITPVAYKDGVQVAKLQTVLVNGRNMHYVWQRGSLPKKLKSGYDVTQDVRRDNGTSQTIHYVGYIPWENWMYGDDMEVRFCADECGCGTVDDSACDETLTIPSLLTTMTAETATKAPKEEEGDVRPPIIHEGKARVQFELDSITLHEDRYETRTGQVLLNKPELDIIRDSIKYALTDPNVTIQRIDIVGYASPESPYSHNSYLAYGRSRALSDFVENYIRTEYGITDAEEKVRYDAVPENWEEFKELVEKDTIPMTAEQKVLLLDLINDVMKKNTAEAYDAAENTLKTDRRLSKLYFNEILPKWFPILRASKFYIRTELKPLTPQQLVKQALATPWMLTVNEFLQATGALDPGVPEFYRIIDLAVETYPDSHATNVNAAVSHIMRGDYDGAEKYLEKAGDIPEALNARGMMEVKRGNIDKAKEYFRRASNDLPSAAKNLHRLGD